MTPYVASGKQDGPASLIERNFPARELSELIAKERRNTDPVYAVHRWWARRPPALMRAILLSAHLPADTPLSEFWQRFSGDDRPLSGKKVLDPFMGGGSTVVEAARLGADVYGSDVDPLAIEICEYELDPAPRDELIRAGRSLLEHLRDELSHFYPKDGRGTPLHYFSLARVECPACGSRAPLYRNLILARDRGRSGAVVRNEELTVFAPSDLSIHHLASADRTRLHYEGRYYNIDEGNFVGSSFRCRNCGARSSHRELRTGKAERELVAVEMVPRTGRRHLRAPRSADLSAISAAAETWKLRRDEAPWLQKAITPDRSDERPISFGMEKAEDLFWPRQLLVLTAAFQWVDDARIPSKVKRGLRLALSNSLLTNNRLCGYATDYGRLSGLFSIRGYSLPILAVELNPIQLEGGRGSIAAAVERVAKADTQTSTRYVWSSDEDQPFKKNAARSTSNVNRTLACTSAESLNGHVDSEVDYCVFDPPYFDYIYYSELSEFHRFWFPHMEPPDQSLVPREKKSVEVFAKRLGKSLLQMVQRMCPGKPIIFTYHSVKEEAWRALALALDVSDLSVTALWPIRSDGHMGHHSHNGNCEWDLIFVCRPTATTTPTESAPTPTELIDLVAPLKVRPSDHASISMACEVVAPRYAALG